jgi:hypothetical protein
MSDDETGLMPAPRHTAPVPLPDPLWQTMRPLLWAVLEAREAADASLGRPDHAAALHTLITAQEAALGQAVACLGFTEGTPQ